jgi:drug/metabolite transporter, DME family
MAVSVTASPAERRGGRSHVLFLIVSGLLWGTGGLTGTELGRVTGLSALAVAAYRLLAGGGLIRGRGRRGAARTTVLALGGLGLLVGLPSGGFGYSAVLASAGLATLAAAGFATLTLIGASPVPGLDASCCFRSPPSAGWPSGRGRPRSRC